MILPLTRVFDRSPDSPIGGASTDGASLQTDSSLASVEDSEDGGAEEALSTSPHPVEGMTVGVALRSPYVWLLTFALGLHSMTIIATSVHFVAIMTWRGLEESTSGILVGVWAFIMTPMMLGMGWMGDR